VRGQAQLAIMDYMGGRPGGHLLTDIARGKRFRGIHFKRIVSAAEALAKEGLITFDGATVHWVRR
jgi:hypothetical protein